MIQKKYYWHTSLKASAVLSCLERGIPLSLVSAFRLDTAGELSIHKDDHSEECLRAHLPGIYDLLPSFFVDESIDAGNTDFKQLYRNNVKREKQLRRYFAPLDESLLAYQVNWFRYSIIECLFQLYDWDFKERSVDRMLSFYGMLPCMNALMDLLGEMLGAKMCARVVTCMVPVLVDDASLGQAILGAGSYICNYHIAEELVMKISIELPIPAAYTEWQEGGDKRCCLEELLARKVPVEWEIEIDLVAVKIWGILPARLGFDLFVN
ncbi:hypothetical protein [Chitinophaga sp. Cy-1792]|uniref:hypothetical protein n=1 Tax=Chitinophaga sp. Cy-1792 TaxID=2608339 RepID=UPI00141F86EE|nr:hypothetical protein [Chitinophaga sp. Cy-1792]NIG53731.1 hypothetical protein [Chitinophaga sp. Cy-1792]